MADFNKKERFNKEQEKEQKNEQAIEPKEQEDREPKEEKKQAQPKPYIHIDTFLQTAAPMYDLSNVQAAGFKAKMRGRHYQNDEQVFMEEFKKHFNIDQDKEKKEDK